MRRLLLWMSAVTFFWVHITACEMPSAKVATTILGSRVAACTTLDCETSFEGDAGLASTAVDSAGVLQVSGAQRTDDAVVMAADSTLTLKGYAIVPSTTTCASKEPISNMTPPAVKDVFAMGEGRWNICVAVLRDAKRVLLRSPEIIVDITAPAVSGAISVAGDNTLTPTLSWPTASDNYAAASEIVYQVRVSTNPMGTISDALIFGDYREVPVGSATVQMSDLVGGTTYYAVVIATDRAGNARMMSQTSFLTGPVGTVAAPSFSVAAGAYGPTQSVVITTSTASAAIYYTIDGVTTPSSATPPSVLYTGPVSVSATQTINAIAIKANYSDSSVASAAYTINGAVAAPSFSVAAGVYGPPQSVVLTSATSGAAIYYTIDGVTTPSSATPPSVLYTGPVSVSSTQTIKAIAIKANYSDSSVASAAYTINGAVAAPSFSVAAGAYGPTQEVVITTSTDGAAIYYTIDGVTTPSSATPPSVLYTGPVSVSATQTIKAIAIKANYSDSSVASAAYTINGAVAAPSFSVVTPGTYGTSQSVVIATSTDGAAIYYTIDGVTTPSSATPPSVLYTEPVSVSSTQTIKAIAIKSGYTDSGILSGTFTIDTTPPGVPALSVSSGSFSAAFDVTVTATSLPDSTFKEFRYAQALGATVTAPADCSAGTQLSSGGVISITAATTAIAVIACDYTGNQSAAVTATYTKVPDAPTSLAGVAGTGKVTLTWSAVPEATGYNLYWNTAGSPTTTSAKISNVSTGYVHADLLRGTTYYYVVTATDSSGESLVSNVALATPPAPIISTIAGNGVTGFSGDGGIGTSANINGPWGVAVDSSGNIYFADKSNNRIRKVTAATGNISTVAGSGVAGYSGDGGVATSANLNAPYGIAVGANGNIYISDYLNHRIRMVAAATGIISTVAGNGSAGFSGDGGAAISASLNYPYAVAVNTAGDLYVADYYNSRIRKISGVTGIISTVAGIGSVGSFSDGGLATSAFIGSPEAVAVDPTGNLYLSDSLAHRVRKVTASTGVITTVLGNGETTWNGDGNAGTNTAINNPGGMAIDASGDLYFVNAGTLGAGTAGSHIIRKLSASTGLVSTVVGTGSSASNGDGGAATSAAVYSPRGVAMDSSGNLYLSEESSRVRKVSGLTSLKPLPPTTLATSPGNGVIALNWPEATGATSYNLYWDNSGSPSKASNKISGVLSGYNHSSLTNGTNYFYVVTSVNAEGESLVSKVASATPASSPASSWVDVTAAGTGGATCAGSPEKCSYKQVSSSLSFTPWLATVDWGTATGTGATSCAGRTYNGKTGWRVPTKDELVAAYAGGVYGINSLSMTGTTWDQYQFWSSTSFSSIYAYIVGLYFGNTVSYTHKLATSALICVRDQLPEIAISAPSVASVDTYTSPSATATYTVTYTDALSITLATGDISKTLTGTANATLSSPTGTGNTRTVTLSSFSGVGTVGISIAANTATNSLGSAGVASSSATVQVTPPTISYSVNPYTAVISTTLTGTPLQSCTASPTLPSGLSINPQNCVISGTPTVSVNSSYTITATNAGGTGTASVNILLCSANSTWNGTICACNTGFTIVNNEWTCQGQAIPFSSNAADGWVDVTTTGPTLTLKDTRTGLKWTNRQPNKLEPQDAINHCNNLTYNGVNGWRLPSNAELVAAAYHGIMGAGRTNWITISELIVSGWYWSTSSRLNGIYYSGNVLLALGYLADNYKPSDGFSVICVQ